MYMTLAIGSILGRGERGFAVIVSKKAARKAVDRNRIKRRMRAIFREFHSAFPAGTVVLAYAKSGASRVPMAQLREETGDLLRRAQCVPADMGQ